ncbi:4Fe-4S dicluster domain-containing protein [Candidatus Bathyarchaeota archaeon]|nr:4Fe-4S dicluster domain-containing protein [Candidatus Bathyarchaeota archaeon]
MPKFRLEFNGAICRWCRSCELICSLIHEGACSPSLSRITITIDQFNAEVSADFCRQCDNPACLRSCPVEGAMVIDERTGATLIVEDHCNGCGSCAEACPFNKEGTVIKFNSERKVYFKCDLCGGKPACVDVCPTGALKLKEIER